jgi:hypothetical protein
MLLDRGGAHLGEFQPCTLSSSRMRCATLSCARLSGGVGQSAQVLRSDTSQVVPPRAGIRQQHIQAKKE